MRRALKVLLSVTALLVLVALFCIITSPFWLIFYAIWQEKTEDEYRIHLEAAEALPKLKAWAAKRLTEPENWRGMEAEMERIGLNPESLWIWYIHPLHAGPQPSELGVASTIGLLASPSGAPPLSAGATLVTTTPKATHFRVVFRAGLRNCGLLIGPPGFTPKDDIWDYMNRWDDQVWFYDDSHPPRDTRPR
jgi:hypothetical protein